MPRQRTPIRYTIAFKLSMVESFEIARMEGVTRVVFCEEKNIPRPTLQNWERAKAKLQHASTRHRRQDEVTGPVPSRASQRTLGGSGRLADTASIEDALLLFIKDERRLEHTVTFDTVILAALELAPDIMQARSYKAQLSWCWRFLTRHSLTLRRISHSGRKTRADLEVLRVAFVTKVVDVINALCVDPRISLPLPRAVFNMDQTAVYCNLGTRSTIEFVGTSCVRSVTSGSDSYRCTMALTIGANGVMLPPHFVYKGQCGADVEREVKSYCDPSVATFSVQANAWFDERVMMEWIELTWKHIVVEPSVLILDSLKVHKKASVADALSATGTAVLYVPGGCTGVAQPLDVGVMSPVKERIRRLNTSRGRGRPPLSAAAERRRDSFDRAMEAV